MRCVAETVGEHVEQPYTVMVPYQEERQGVRCVTETVVEHVEQPYTVMVPYQEERVARRCVMETVVENHEAGLLMIEGRIVERLAPGRDEPVPLRLRLGDMSRPLVVGSFTLARRLRRADGCDHAVACADLCVSTHRHGVSPSHRRDSSRAIPTSSPREHTGTLGGSHRLAPTADHRGPLSHTSAAPSAAWRPRQRRGPSPPIFHLEDRAGGSNANHQHHQHHQSHQPYNRTHF